MADGPKTDLSGEDTIQVDRNEATGMERRVRNRSQNRLKTLPWIQSDSHTDLPERE